MTTDQQQQQPTTLLLLGGGIDDDTDSFSQQESSFDCELTRTHSPQTVTVVPIEKDAPSPENWYHGRLDRVKSEERLRVTNKAGAFLVRESDRKPGSFVLCYLSYKFHIFHFKITAVFGDYYIGGREFDRLETLISYYMYYSELVKGEKLIYPVAPPILGRLERICISVKPYQHGKPSSDPDLNASSAMIDLNNSEDILYFDHAGQLFRVFHQVGEGDWLWAQSFDTNECGLLYSRCVEFIEDHQLHEIEPWYYPNISKDEAATILANAGLFSYLVRPSEQSPGDFTLFFNINNLVHRFRIAGLVDNETGCKYYSIGGRQFSSISLIINRYMNEDITEGFRLSKTPHIHEENYSSTSLFQKARQQSNQPEETKVDQLLCTSRRNVFSKKKSFSFSTESPSSAYFANAVNSPVAKAKPYPAKRNSITTTGLNGIDPDLEPGNEVNGYYSKLSDIMQSPTTSPSTRHSDGYHTTLTQSANSAFTSISNNGFAPHQPDAEPEHTVLESLVANLAPAALKTAQHASAVPSTTFVEPRHSQSTKVSANKKQQLSVSKSLSSPISSIVSGSKTSDFLNLSSRGKNLIAAAPSHRKTTTTTSNLKTIGAADMLKRHSDKIALKGFLSKYSDKTKKWKIYYFILNQTDQQLFYFTDDKRMKEKGMIDLSYGFYYPIDDSFFNRPFCFEIIIHSLGNSANMVHYLCAESYQSFKEWTENIRPLCNPVQYNPFVSPNAASSNLSNSSSLSLSSSSGTSSSSSPHQTIAGHQPLSTDRSSSLKALLNQSSLYGGQSSELAPSNNYRILRTLNVDIHEARNVCFTPLAQVAKEPIVNGNHQATTNGTSYSHFAAPPKFHKENLYYCLVMFNNEAFVASTRSSTCVSNTISVSALSNSAGGSTVSNLLTNEIASLNSNGNLTSKDAIWDDTFSFDNLPLDVHELKLCMFVQAKRSNLSAQLVNNLKKMSGSTTSKFLDPLLIGYVNVKLDDLMNKGLVEQWYQVEPTVNVEQAELSSETNLASLISLSNSCTMRVKIRFCEEKIQLNVNHYKLLSDFLLDEYEHKHMCTLYEQIIPSSERSHLVHALLRFYIVKHRLVDTLKSYLVTEIDRCSDLSTIFRPATLCTSLMDNYMRTRCDEFLVKSLQEPLTRILRWDFASAPNTASAPNGATGVSNSSNISFELDPSKCADAHQRDQNLVNFQAALKELINSICSAKSTGLFPQELKYLFYLIRQHVHLKWQQQTLKLEKDAELTGTNSQDDRQIRIYCVSAFVFLRLLCPAMLNPKSFGLKFFPATTTSPKVNLSSTLNGLILESSSLMAATAAASPVSANDHHQQAANELPQPYPASRANQPKHTINYPKLATQFTVFSPAFMFSLMPSQNANPNNSFSVTSSSSYVVQDSNSLLLNSVAAGVSAQPPQHHQSINASQLSSLATTLSNASTSSSASSSSSSYFSSSSFSSNSNNSIQNASTYERHIKLLAKVLQTLANMTECKEPFMLPLSSFLGANKPTVIKFIEDVSNVSDFSDSHSGHYFEPASGQQADDMNVQFEHATCKYLAILHRLLSSFIPAMKVYLTKSATSSPSSASSSSSSSSSTSSEPGNETECEKDTALSGSLQRLIGILEDINVRTAKTT